MTLRFYLTSFRIAKIKTQVIAHAGEDVEQGVYSCTVDIYKSISISISIILLQDFSIPLLVIYPNDVPPYHKNTYSTMFLSSFIHNSQKPETTIMSLN